MAYRPRAGSGFLSGPSDIHPSAPFRPTCRTDTLYNFPMHTQALSVPYSPAPYIAASGILKIHSDHRPLQNLSEGQSLMTTVLFPETPF